MSLLQASESSVSVATGQQRPDSFLCQQHSTVVPGHTDDCVAYKQLIAVHTVYNMIILASCIYPFFCADCTAESDAACAACLLTTPA